MLMIAGGVTFAAYGDPMASGDTGIVNGSDAGIINGSGTESLSSTVPPADYVPVQPSESKPRMLMAAPAVLSSSSKALIIEDVYPWGYPSNERALQQLGISYDVIGSSKLATTDLSQYRMVIIPSDQYTSTYNNLINNKNKLSEYVQNGGILIAHVCDAGWNRGYWSSSFLPLGVTHVTSYNDYLSIVDQTNPIVSQISDAQLDGWFYSSHGYLTNAPAGAHTIIGLTSNPLSYPTYVEYSYGSGTVLVTDQTIEWPWQRARSWFGTAHESLLKNELMYAYNGAGGKPDLAITSDDITFEVVA